MANQELYNKNYPLPQEVLKGVQSALVAYPTGEGVKRAKFMLKNRMMTYQALKRLKNYFDNYNPQTDNKEQFKLAGGQQMKKFIDTSLGSDRHAVASGKRVKQDMAVNFRTDIMPNRPQAINEEKKDKDEKKEDNELSKNAVAVIVNNDNKILLLKRGGGAPWMPNKWALVGGGVEDGEDTEKACKREIEEETGLVIKKFIESFTIQRHEDSEETVFACRFIGEDTDIELDKSENVSYGWYDTSEMEYLDTVPHLIEYITLVFKKYD